MLYVPTNVEVMASNILLDHGVTSLWHLNIYDLANAFEVKVKYLPIDSTILFYDKNTVIIINDRESARNQYSQFLHELSHHIQEHIAYQYLDNFQLKYFEMKANYLVQYLAIPYFLIDILKGLKTVNKVADYFYVSQEIAQKRIEGIKSRIYSMRGDYYASIQRQTARDMVFSN